MKMYFINNNIMSSYESRFSPDHSHNMSGNRLSDNRHDNSIDSNNGSDLSDCMSESNNTSILGMGLRILGNALRYPGYVYATHYVTGAAIYTVNHLPDFSIADALEKVNDKKEQLALVTVAIIGGHIIRRIGRSTFA